MTLPKPRQRIVNPEHETDAALLRLSHPARLTAKGLWMAVDDFGHVMMRPELLAGRIYPGEPVPPALIEVHVLEMAEAGFLQLYSAAGADWVELRNPLVTPRPTACNCPRPGAPESSGGLMAVGGGSAGGRERWASERGPTWVAGPEPDDPEPQSRASWEQQQETRRPRRPPEVPLILRAGPIGCDEHPNNQQASCGPCGTAFTQHKLRLAELRYNEQLKEWRAAGLDPDAPTESVWGDGGRWADG